MKPRFLSIFSRNKMFPLYFPCPISADCSVMGNNQEIYASDIFLWGLMTCDEISIWLSVDNCNNPGVYWGHLNFIAGWNWSTLRNKHMFFFSMHGWTCLSSVYYSFNTFPWRCKKIRHTIMYSITHYYFEGIWNITLAVPVIRTVFFPCREL